MVNRLQTVDILCVDSIAKSTTIEIINVARLLLNMFVCERFGNCLMLLTAHFTIKDVVTPYTHISEASRYILYTNMIL